MKLIIEIANELAEKGHWYTDEEMWTVIKAVQNGTPIPDNATNGDIMQMMFPNADIEIHISGSYVMTFDFDWWNAPYQKGGKE